jgi:hypothetical protein
MIATNMSGLIPLLTIPLHRKPYVPNDDFMEDLERKEIAIAHRYPKSPTYDYDSNLFEDSMGGDPKQLIQ